MANILNVYHTVVPGSLIRLCYGYDNIILCSSEHVF